MTKLINHSTRFWFACLCWVAFASAAHAQQSPTASSTDTALQNNIELQNAELKVRYQESILGSYRTVEPTQITAEVGQMNSAYTDNKIAIQQNIHLPKFYDAQRKVLISEKRHAELGKEVLRWQLQRQAALLQNTLAYLDEKEKLIRTADSIYSNYYKRAELRLKAGESSILEKTTAETYRSEARLQLISLQNDREMTVEQLQLLFGTDEPRPTEKRDFFLNFSEKPAQDSLLPQLHQLAQQKETEEAKIAAEKAKVLPSFTVGVSSMTMRGVGADNKEYDAAARFQTATIGLAVPIFTQGQKAMIEGQKINRQIAESNYLLAVRKLESRRKILQGEIKKYSDQLRYFRTDGLKNAEKILFTANLLLKEGEINYLEYSTLVNQALDIKNRYLETQNQLNEKMIELNYLTIP